MGTRMHEEQVEVEIVGCSGLGSRMSVDRSAVAEGQLKVQFGAGYEHFDLDRYVDREGVSVPVFVWTDRTWIAE